MAGSDIVRDAALPPLLPGRPGSNPRFLEKAQGLDADQVFLDIEDSVAPLAKPEARKNIVGR